MDRLEPGDPEQIGEFWLAGRLGAGGQGVVYDAYGPDGGRAAVKVLHGAQESPQELARMAAEARAAQRVASFCTARIVQVHLEPPRPYIVSEYIDGRSLQAAVTGAGGREPRRFGGDDLHRLGIGIATALTAIHQAKVVHRDLKPGNVMLGPDGPRLIDFGIARVLDTHSASQGGGLVGTLRYMPPEVYAGRRAGAAADVFAWGAIMVFAATGRPAFAGGDLPQIAHRVRTHDPDLSALPDALQGLVAAALSKDPLERPSARTILAALTGDPRAGADDPRDLVAAGAAQAGLYTGWEPGDPALGELAEDAYTALPPDEQTLVPEVFLRCLVPGEDGSWSTRPVPAGELLDRQDPSEVKALERVVQAFAPLLTVVGAHTGARVGEESERTAEQIVLTRPAVLRAWPRLREWAESRRRELPVHHRIRQAARVWDDNGRRRGDVLTGAYLDQTVGWATAGRRPSLNRAERSLLDASTRAQTIRTRRTRTVALVLAVTTLLSLAATGWAVRAQQNAADQRDIANRQRDAVVSSQLVTQSEQVADPAVSALLAAAAWKIRETPESRAGLLDILAEPDRAIFSGHVGSVYSVAFSPDGRTLATGSDSVRLWDVASRRSIGTFGHADPVSVAFSPDGGTLASGDGDGTVRLWDVASRRPIATLTGHTDSVRSVAFSPDGGILATGSYDDTVRLWDVASHRPIATLTGHTKLVRSVAFSPDGRTLASSSRDDTVRLWDVDTRGPIATLTDPAESGQNDDVEAVAFSPNGGTLATSSNDGTVRLWDVGARRPIATLGPAEPGYTGQFDTAPVMSVAFSPDGRTLATSSDDDTVRVWDVGTRRLIATLTGHTTSIASVAFGSDGRTLATGSLDGTARLWDVGARRPIATLTGPTDPDHTDYTGPVASVAFTPDGRTLATGSSEGAVQLWDVGTRRLIATLTGHAGHTGHGGTARSVAFSPDGRTLATGMGSPNNGMLRLWNVGSRSPTVTLDDTRPVLSVAFGPDGGTLATGSRDGTVRLWDVASRRTIASLTVDSVLSVAFSPDGGTLAIGSSDGTVRLWDVASRRTIATLTGHTDGVEAVDFNSDGSILATGSRDETVRLWDVASRRTVATLTGHTDNVRSVAFRPDGLTLATGSGDGTVRLWDVATRSTITTLTGPAGGVEAVDFASDGRTLAAGSSIPIDLGDGSSIPIDFGSGDGVTWLWDVAMPADLAGAVCAVAGRTLTTQEWDRYLPAGFEFRRVCP